MNSKLVIVSGPQEGQTHLLEGESFCIGRQDGSHLQILTETVSRRHCEIRRQGEGWELHDLDSSHGTFVNTVPVRRHRLEHSDLIQVGPASLLFLRDISSDLITGADDSLAARTTLEKRPEEIAALVREPRRSGSSGDALALLLEVSTTVQEIRDAESLAERLLELLFESLPAEQAAVLLVSPERDTPELVASRGEGLFEPSRTVLARALGDGVALLSDDAHHDEALGSTESLQRTAVRSLLAAPLSGRRDRHGVLYFQSTVGGVFTEAHLELVAAAAGIAGLAFDTARAFAGLTEENRRLRAAGSEHGMVGESAAMERLLGFIARVGPVDSTVLLRGESGTGKELVARALHRASPRADGPFIEINCATLSETLLESELFGHERGAFTGAVARKIGKLEAAQDGTLFLDEVGEMPITLQARLLRALQERRFARVGATRLIEVDVRIVAATNRDLEAAIRGGTFRQDLFYRLNVIACTLPPLRERREDIPLLARHFIRRHGERLKRPGVGIEPGAQRALIACDWPGNVRQLANAIERALVLGDGEMIRPEDLPDELLEESAAEVPLSDYQAVITETRKRILTSALAEADGNAAEAGRRLGLHPNSFRRLMRQLGLKDPSGSPQRP